MERLHPGVYIQEISSGVRPIEGVSTSTTAFIGKTQKGSIAGPELVTNFTEFQTAFGDFLSDGFVAHAALQYFNNGGKRLYVARVVPTGQAATTASVGIADRVTPTPAKALTVAAQSPGAWPSTYTITIGNATVDSANQFRLTVNRGNDVVETFDNVSVNPDAINFVDRAVNGRSRVVTVTTNPAITGQAASSTGGSGAAIVLSDAARRSMVVEINNEGPRTITLAGAADTGANIATAIRNAVRALPPLRSVNANAYATFDATFTASGPGGTNYYTLTVTETGRRSSVRVTNAPAASNAANLLKLGPANGGSEITGSAVLRPLAGTFALSGASPQAGGPVVEAAIGTDGGPVTDADLINNGLPKLDAITDVNIVAIPGRGTPAIVDAGTAYCTQRGDCFYIGETGAADDTTAKAQTFINTLTVKSSFGAVYFPWIRATDPTGQSATPILVPPSGFVAGVYARTDARRGVWKAPAGAEANLSGVVGLLTQTSDAQQDTLNPIGANVIRFFPSSGVVIWGARTLSTLSDPEYRYVPIRRLALFLERSIFNGIQWAVFEPNDEDLWSSLRLNIGAFMMNMFRAGAFQGATPSQAFFVKCDSETNPQSEIDAGVVNVLIGFAPVRPAEFVVIKISQKAGDAAI